MLLNVFKFRKNCSLSDYAKGVEPDLVGWDGKYETFFNKTSGRGCKDLATANNSRSSNEYCTAIIWYNGWKVPDDYPLKF